MQWIGPFIPLYAIIILALELLDAERRWPLPSKLVLPVYLAILLAQAVRGVRFEFALIRMENANAPSLLTGEVLTPATGRAEPVHVGSDESLIVRYGGKSLVRSYGGAAVAEVAAVAVTLVTENPILYIPAIVATTLLTVVLAYLAILAILGLRPGRRAAVLDRQGISSPFLDVRVGWQEVTEVRVLPQRGTLHSRTRHRVVAFVLADPERVLGRIRGWKARGARLDLSYYGSPLALADQMLDHSVEEITAAVQAFTTVPVRRLDG